MIRRSVLEEAEETALVSHEQRASVGFRSLEKGKTRVKRLVRMLLTVLSLSRGYIRCSSQTNSVVCVLKKVIYRADVCNKINVWFLCALCAESIWYCQEVCIWVSRIQNNLPHLIQACRVLAISPQKSASCRTKSTPQEPPANSTKTGSFTRDE